MKKNLPFIRKGLLSWNLLPFMSIVYASVREILISRIHGNQPDSWLIFISGVLLFYWFTYYFMKRYRGRYNAADCWILGALWGLLSMGMLWFVSQFFFHLSITDVLSSYRIMEGEPWPWIVGSITVAPRFIYSLIH